MESEIALKVSEQLINSQKILPVATPLLLHGTGAVIPITARHEWDVEFYMENFHE
jgi:hypothetical protein